jgi:hypothetical protein
MSFVKGFREGMGLHPSYSFTKLFMRMGVLAVLVYCGYSEIGPYTAASLGYLGFLIEGNSLQRACR